MSRSVLAALGRVPLYVVVSALAILMALPFYWVVITALSPTPDMLYDWTGLEQSSLTPVLDSCDGPRARAAEAAAREAKRGVWQARGRD